MSSKFPKNDHPWVDDSDSPLYILTYPDVTTDKILQERHDELIDWYRTVDSKMVWVIDASKIVKTHPIQRKIVSDHVKEAAPYTKRYVAGCAFVLESKIIRGIIAAVFWMNKPPWPYRFFSNQADARVWAQEELNQYKLPPE